MEISEDKLKELLEVVFKTGYNTGRIESGEFVKVALCTDGEKILNLVKYPKAEFTDVYFSNLKSLYLKDEIK